MNTFSTFWSRRRNRLIAGTVGAGLAGVMLAGGVIVGADAATMPAAPTAAVVPAAATTASPSTPVKTDAARLRAAIRGIRDLPVAQRPAAFARLKADVLAGKYGAAAKRDLAAIDAIVAADPAGLRDALLRLAAVHPHRSTQGSSTPAPAPSTTPSASS
jgi:hypothetical protein